MINIAREYREFRRIYKVKIRFFRFLITYIISLKKAPRFTTKSFIAKIYSSFLNKGKKELGFMSSLI